MLKRVFGLVLAVLILAGMLGVGASAAPTARDELFLLESQIIRELGSPQDAEGRIIAIALLYYRNNAAALNQNKQEYSFSIQRGILGQQLDIYREPYLKLWRSDDSIIAQALAAGTAEILVRNYVIARNTYYTALIPLVREYFREDAMQYGAEHWRALSMLLSAYHLYNRGNLLFADYAEIEAIFAAVGVTALLTYIGDYLGSIAMEDALPTPLSLAGEFAQSRDQIYAANAEVIALLQSLGLLGGTPTPPPEPGNTIFGTGWEATRVNWMLFFVFFGWIWMWF